MSDQHHQIEIWLPRTLALAESQTEEAVFGEPTTLERTVDRVGRAHLIDPVSVAVVATVSWIASRLVNHWLKDDEQGVLVDLRSDPPIFSRIEGTPSGFIVLIDTEGVTHPPIQATYDKPEELMPLLTSWLATKS